MADAHHIPWIESIECQIEMLNVESEWISIIRQLRYNLKPGAVAIVSRLVERRVIRFDRRKKIGSLNIFHFGPRSASYYNKAFIFHKRQERNCILTCINFLTCGERIYALELR